MLIGRESAPIGATECYGFPVGGFGSWHLSEEEKAEREKEYREKYCTDKPNQKYYAEKYEQIFMIFYKAAEWGIYDCSTAEWDYLWGRREYYRQRSERYLLQRDYMPKHQRQNSKEMWKRLCELKQEVKHKQKEKGDKA